MNDNSSLSSTSSFYTSDSRLPAIIGSCFFAGHSYICDLEKSISGEITILEHTFEFSEKLHDDNLPTYAEAMQGPEKEAYEGAMGTETWRHQHTQS